MSLSVGNGSVNGKEEKQIEKPQFVYEGNRFVIPASMTLDDAEIAIQRQKKEESVVVTLGEKINAFPLDGAVALMRVLQKKYGWVGLCPTPGFWGSEPPKMIGIETGPNPEDRLQVPWGRMRVPNIDGTIETGHTFDNGMPIFTIGGSILRRHERIVAEIAREVRDEVIKNSIYRGKAIKINFRNSDDERREFDAKLAPRFMDISASDTSEPIFSKTIEDQIRLHIINPIRYSERFKQNGVPLKSGVMLGGPYGTGKTLTAFQIARECVANGWTFLYLEDVRDLDLAINFAKLYQPCVLFAEDVDKAVSGGRTPEMDRILNTIDGVESKGDQSLITVLTTNCIENIHRSFLRPGRIDTVISVLPPDNDAGLRIVKKYVAKGGCELSGSDSELKDAIKCLLGANAAFYQTTVEAAKKSAMERAEVGQTLVISANDLAIAAQGMQSHCRLINPEHGQKSLAEIGEEQVHEPIAFAMEILSQKLAENVLGQFMQPKKIAGIITKAEKRANRQNIDPSVN